MSNFSRRIGEKFYIYRQIFLIILDINIDEKVHIRHKKPAFYCINPDTFRGNILQLVA